MVFGDGCNRSSSPLLRQARWVSEEVWIQLGAFKVASVACVACVACVALVAFRPVDIVEQMTAGEIT